MYNTELHVHILIICAFYVQVSVHGYFSMGGRPQYGSMINFSEQTSYSVIAPCNRHISYNDGVVKYTQFTLNSSQLSDVSGFIQSQTGSNFN